jgi:preprotein translocase subunit SecA
MWAARKAVEQKKVVVANEEDSRAKIFENNDDYEVFEVVDADEKPEQKVVKPQWKVRPNDPCPCGSGKKYKKCHWKDE